jgi:ribosomal protein S18 acetylase RimI-like enzyme
LQVDEGPEFPTTVLLIPVRLGIGLFPGFAQLAAIEEEEDQRHQEEHGLVERAGNREQAERGEPADRPWNPAMGEYDPHRLRRPPEERAHLQMLRPGIPIRLLAPGDEDVVRELATYDGPGDPEALLADPRTLMLVAFDGERPVGFVLAHELPRRHGDRSNLFVYEVDVAESHQRRGIASALLTRLAELARERGIPTGFVLTEPDNGPANALYRSVGGATDSVTVQWEFSYADD